MYEAANTVCRIQYESAYHKPSDETLHPVLHFFGPHNHGIFDNLISCIGMFCIYDSKTSADKTYYTDLYVYVDSQTHYDNCVIFLNTVASRYPTYKDSVTEAKVLLHENSPYENKAPRVGMFQETPPEAPSEAVQKDANNRPVEGPSFK